MALTPSAPPTAPPAAPREPPLEPLFEPPLELPPNPPPPLTTYAPAFIEPDPALPVLPKCKLTDWQKKKIDITLYGATGFLGKRCAEYLASHPEKPRIAYAGRDKQKLEALRGRLLTGEDLPAMSLTNESKLLMMAKQTRVILNLAGPNPKIGGHRLIQAAIDGCAHYVDVTVETFYKQFVMQQYGPNAKARGVAIVQSAGFTSLVPDMLAMTAALQLENKYGPPDNVAVGWTTLNGLLPDSLTNAYDHDSYGNHGLVKQPYMSMPFMPHVARADTEDATAETQDELSQQEAVFGTDLEQYNGAFHDCAVIRRSMQFMYPGRSILVGEVQNKSVSNHLYLFKQDQSNMERTSSGLPQWLKTGSFSGGAVASRRTSGGGSARVYVSGRGDPFVTGSSMVAAELALGLAYRGLVEGNQAGFPTPALALGDPDMLKQRIESIHHGQFIQFS